MRYGTTHDETCPICGGGFSFFPILVVRPAFFAEDMANELASRFAPCRSCGSLIGSDERGRPQPIHVPQEARWLSEEREIRGRNYTRDEAERGEMTRDQERLTELRRMMGGAL